MSDDVIYMIPTEAKTINLTPIDDVIYLDPEDESGAQQEWVLITTLTMDSVNASPDIVGLPGDYTGYYGFLNLAYSYVKCVAVSGSWDDGTTIQPSWQAYMNVVTQVDYAFFGTAEKFYDSASAAEAWVGSTVTLKVGEDGLFGWGIKDYGPNNSGTLTFKVFGKL